MQVFRAPAHSARRCVGAFVFGFGVLASACSGDGDDTRPDGGAGQAVRLSFVARAGDQPFSCSQPLVGLGNPPARVEALDFRFYVHDVRLVTAAGGEVPVTLDQDGKWQSGAVALLDFEDRSGACANGTVDTNAVVSGAVPPGTYTGVKLRLGVPFAFNHANAAVAASPLNLSSLWWGWNGGYKFLRADFRVAADTDAGAGDAVADGGADADTTHETEAGVFNVHIGSTGCMGDPATGGVKSCANPNRAEITLGAFDPARDRVVVDLGALLATTNLAADQGGSPGCMSAASDPECVALLPRLGVDVASGAPAAGQVFMRKE